MAVITRWSYKRGGRKAGFHCISNLTRLTAVVCMKVRFEAKITKDFSLSPRVFRDSLSPPRGLLLISFAKKNQEKPLGPG